MKKHICIAGAGPGGLLMGKEFARAGFAVTIGEMLEKEAYLSKYDWSDAVELCILKDAELPIPFAKGDRWYGPGVIGQGAENPMYQPRRASELGLYAPDYSCHTVTDADFRFVLTDRGALQRYQLVQTESAGAEIRYGYQVVELLGNHLDDRLGEIRVQGVVVEKDGVREEISADVVVDATGQAAALRTMLKGAPEISQPFDSNQYGLVYKPHRKCSNTDVVATEADWDHPPMRQHYRLRDPRGYLFFHPHDEHQFDIGGGARTIEEARANCETVLSKIPGYTGEKTGEAVERNLKCLPPDAIVASGFLVVGHAAAQVHPTHGCGISTAYMGALLAAQILKRAENFDIDTLWEYAYRWMSTQGAHFVALFHRLKNLETDEMVFLIENNLINSETMTNDYNGNYMPPNVNEIRRLEDVYPQNPALVSKWMQAEAQANRGFEHFSSYPARWGEYAFASWRAKKPD